MCGTIFGALELSQGSGRECITVDGRSDAVSAAPDSTGVGGGAGAGGGVSIENCSPTISHCIISENSAVFDGGISLWNHSFPVIQDCTIAKNRANHFGPVYAGGIGMPMSSPMITNCLIWGDSSVCGGGGIMVRDSSFPTSVNCTITANEVTGTKPGSGAGGIYSSDSVATLVNCILSGDVSTEILVANTIFYPNRVPVMSYSDVPWGGRATSTPILCLWILPTETSATESVLHASIRVPMRRRPRMISREPHGRRTAMGTAWPLWIWGPMKSLARRGC